MTEQSNTEVWQDIKELVDVNGNVSKFVFTKDSAVAETVLYKYLSYETRTVICCSVQSGCPIGCRFCGSGDFFVRNLTTEEIVSQSEYALMRTGVKTEEIEKLQIMFMSMGEPMMNLPRLIEALRILHEKYPQANLLVSTSAPDVDYEPLFRIAEEIESVGLQFSVHESTDEARNNLIPFKKKLTLSQIAEKGVEFFERTNRQPFFNYCAHDKNTSQEDADKLRELFEPEIWQATVSVICERDETMKAAHDRQEELTSGFMSMLLNAGYGVRRFDPAGQDTIGGGCGQLPHVQRWAKENPDKARLSVGARLPIKHSVT